MLVADYWRKGVVTGNIWKNATLTRVFEPATFDGSPVQTVAR